MPKHITISMLDGYKSTAADLADPTTTADTFVTISMGDTIGTIRTGPVNAAFDNVRRAIEESLVAAPATVPLFGVKSNVVGVADTIAIADGDVGITIGADVLPKSTSTQFRERIQNAVDAFTEGLA